MQSNNERGKPWFSIRDEDMEIMTFVGYDSCVETSEFEDRKRREGMRNLLRKWKDREPTEQEVNLALAQAEQFGDL